MSRNARKRVGPAPASDTNRANGLMLPQGDDRRLGRRIVSQTDPCDPPRPPRTAASTLAERGGHASNPTARSTRIGLLLVLIPLALGAGPERPTDAAGEAGRAHAARAKRQASVDLRAHLESSSATATAQGIRGIPGARPGAYTEMVVVLRLLEVPTDAPVALEVLYPAELLGPLRIVSKDRAWALDESTAGAFQLSRGGFLESPPETAAEGPKSSIPLPPCESPDQGDWVAHFALQVRAPEKTSPDDLTLSLRGRTPETATGTARACAASVVFRTRGLLGGERSP